MAPLVAEIPANPADIAGWTRSCSPTASARNMPKEIGANIRRPANSFRAKIMEDA